MVQQPNKLKESNMRSFKQIASLVRGEDVLEEGKKSLGTGWMLKADPKLGKAVKDKIDLAKKRQATYGDKSAGKSIKEEGETIEEAGLWDNIHAKRERIKKGSGERMRKPGSEGAPSEKDLKNSQTNEEVLVEGAPIVVAIPPIHIRDPKKAPQPYRNQGDIVSPTKPPSTEKRGVKGRPGQRPMPTYEEVELTEADAKDYHSVHVNGRHWKTFDTKSHAENVAKKVKGATVHKYDAERLQQNYGAKSAARNAARGKQWDESVDVEQLDEMPGANMDTRAVHQHLKKRGWKLSRTSGSHDVYTHPEAKHHIPVPRHRQLKAPLVKGILKQAEINEQAESDTTEKTELAQTQLHFIKYAAEEILEFIEMGGEIEEWYQNKLSKVQSDVESLHSYIEGESRRTGMKEEVEMDEAATYGAVTPTMKAKSKQIFNAGVKHGKAGADKDKTHMSSLLFKKTYLNGYKQGMKEEVEQIDELSKKTLGSYVNKAMDSARELPGAGTNAEASKKTKRYAAVSAAAYRTQGLAPRKGTDMFKKYNAESVVAEGVSLKQKHEDKKRADQNQVRYGKMTQAEFDKKWTRTERPNPTDKKQGVAEGPDQIDELSKETMGSYIKKASKDIEGKKQTQSFGRRMAMQFSGPRGEEARQQKKIDKRHSGISTAVDKLTKEQGVAEEVGQSSNSNENPNAGRFTSGPAKKPAKPTPIVTAEQTATDLGKERHEVPFDGPYAKNTVKNVTDKSGAKHTAMSRVKHLAKTAARKQAGIKEEQEPEDSFEKTSTPAKRSLSKTAGIVKDLAKNSKSSSKEKADTFQAEPELSSQIIKT
jgi:predicted RNA binding protein YcfA (HicA-like mRNA interferase family)